MNVLEKIKFYPDINIYPWLLFKIDNFYADLVYLNTGIEKKFNSNLSDDFTFWNNNLKTTINSESFNSQCDFNIGLLINNINSEIVVNKILKIKFPFAQSYLGEIHYFVFSRKTDSTKIILTLEKDESFSSIVISNSQKIQNSSMSCKTICNITNIKGNFNANSLINVDNIDVSATEVSW